MKNPRNYKTQNGLLKAITKAQNQAMDCKLANWFINAKYTLIDVFGWEEKQTSRYIAGYMPHQTKYTATA